MKANGMLLAAGASASALAGGALDAADTVKRTPFGSHDDECCRRDRALVLEDPNATRLLYDPGRTVAGPYDTRLGQIDAVLVSLLRADHVGERHISKPNTGICSKP
jgi:hypothetical protein